MRIWIRIIGATMEANPNSGGRKPKTLVFKENCKNLTFSKYVLLSKFFKIFFTKDLS